MSSILKFGTSFFNRDRPRGADIPEFLQKRWGLPK